ncbi:hypothetical protein ACFY2K_26185 [Kitasatospora sp. NPDC001309]|uniref:hypothetical protein n=1 Tax=Kitasatospora sp. NPDC001309 TaxID=3364013 RepID=UPI00369D83FB
MPTETEALPHWVELGDGTSYDEDLRSCAEAMGGWISLITVMPLPGEVGSVAFFQLDGIAPDASSVNARASVLMSRLLGRGPIHGPLLVLGLGPDGESTADIHPKVIELLRNIGLVPKAN